MCHESHPAGSHCIFGHCVLHAQLLRSPGAIISWMSYAAGKLELHSLTVSYPTVCLHEGINCHCTLSMQFDENFRLTSHIISRSSHYVVFGYWFGLLSSVACDP